VREVECEGSKVGGQCCERVLNVRIAVVFDSSSVRIASSMGMKNVRARE
jgi:hypothetical protein